jgi:ACR3 family arsenite efflux pump ArsB
MSSNTKTATVDTREGMDLFGLQSGAALAAVVGALVEIPLMLMLVKIANSTRNRFTA